MARRLAPPPINVYESMIAFDPTNKDRNKTTAMRDEKEKRRLILDLYRKYEGQQVVLTREGGECMTVEVQGIFGRNMLQHVLFGSWRFAQPEDIARSNQLEAQRAEIEAAREARAQATQAGRFFSETLGAAEKIVRFNDARDRLASTETAMAQEPVAKPAGKKTKE